MRDGRNNLRRKAILREKAKISCEVLNRFKAPFFLPPPSLFSPPLLDVGKFFVISCLL